MRLPRQLECYACNKKMSGQSFSVVEYVTKLRVGDRLLRLLVQAEPLHSGVGDSTVGGRLRAGGG